MGLKSSLEKLFKGKDNEKQYTEGKYAKLGAVSSMPSIKQVKTNGQILIFSFRKKIFSSIFSNLIFCK